MRPMIIASKKERVTSNTLKIGILLRHQPDSSAQPILDHVPPHDKHRLTNLPNFLIS